ncbi:MAG: hypothetical protein ACPG4X_18650 [Pikeienuella sp.]
MGVFPEVNIPWDGEDYTIPANNQLAIIAEVEEILMTSPSGEVNDPIFLLLNDRVPRSKMAAAYGATLRHAGAEVSDDEIYLAMVEDISGKATGVNSVAWSVVMGLLALMAPPVYQDIVATKADAPKKKPKPARSRGKASSAKPMKSASGKTL